MIGSLVQIIIAVALVILLGVVGFVIYNAEMVKAIRESGRVKRSTVIFDGVKDLSVSKDETYNTIDPAHPMYRNLETSVNQPGGAEYAYNFWLYLGNNVKGALNFNPIAGTVAHTDVGLTSKANRQQQLPVEHQPFVLFLRGNKEAMPFKGLCGSETKVDVLVKQPMVKLEQGGDVLSIEMNTQKSPEGVKEKARDTCADNTSDWESANSYRIALKGLTSRSDVQDNWNMVTLVVQDTYPSDPLPIRNKIRVRLYFNGQLELDRYVDGKLSETSSSATLLRGNSGNLYIAPQIRYQSKDLARPLTIPKQVMMANLTYFNYAVDGNDIKNLLNAKFRKSYAPSMSANTKVEDMSFMSNYGYVGEDTIFSELGRGYKN